MKYFHYLLKSYYEEQIIIFFKINQLCSSSQYFHLALLLVKLLTSSQASLALNTLNLELENYFSKSEEVHLKEEEDKIVVAFQKEFMLKMGIRNFNLEDLKEVVVVVIN